jgi:hypothetical protein
MRTGFSVVLRVRALEQLRVCERVRMRVRVCQFASSFLRQRLSFRSFRFVCAGSKFYAALHQRIADSGLVRSIQDIRRTCPLVKQTKATREQPQHC